MKITKRQLRRIIKEEKAKLINEDAFDNVMRTASQILGPNIELDEEMDGNIIIVADEMDVEANYDQLMAAFPNGEMVEDGFVTGVMQESKISKSQLRRIVKEEKARLSEQPSMYTQSGDPQSYNDFSERLDAITRMIEDLTMDYVDSEWLDSRDHESLGRDLDVLFRDVDGLRGAARGLSNKMGGR